MHLFRPFSNPLRAEIERPRFVYDDGNLTVGKYLDRFLEDVQRGSVRESTYSRNKYLVASHAKPALGRVRLKRGRHRRT